MDNREIEKLMDKYKKEMLEYSKKNQVTGAVGGASASTNKDEREEMQVDAIANGEAFQRDRRDPVKSEKMSEKQEKADDKKENTESAFNVAGSYSPDIICGTVADIDVRKNLIKECENISANPNAGADQKKRCSEITEFLSSHKENGLLRVEAFAAERVYGIGSARVLIFLPLPSGNVTLFDGLTNMNGETASVRLPAPAKSLSLTPSSSKVLPYSVYSVYVERSGFVPAAFGNVPVFSEIESVQPVQLLAEIGSSQNPEAIITDESSPNYL